MPTDGSHRVPLNTIVMFVAAIVCVFCAAGWGLVESVESKGINARVVHRQGVTGSGIHIAMLSSGNARASHEAFSLPDGQRIITNYDFSGKGIAATSHDTQVAAIVVSRGGADYAECKGVAPGATLHSVRLSDGSISASVVERALHAMVVNQGCRVVVTGIQLPSTSSKPDGTSVWANLYDYYAEHYDVFFANAAGNSESAVTIFGDGHNGVTTGGLALDEYGRWFKTGSISNSGPTVDGRRKPELMAPAHRLMLPSASGYSVWAAGGSPRGETSFAAPHTAGAAALLMERAAQTETPYGDKSLTIKAILVNSADPNLLGKSNRLTHPDENVWHPDRGYGRLDVGRAINVLDAGRIRPETTLSAAAGWAYETMDSDQRHSYRIAAKKGERLVVTLTWHRKQIRIGTLLFAEERPRFNVLLDVRSPDGTVLFSESDEDNNLRKASLILPEDGEYTLIVRNPTHQQRRDYAMAFERRDSQAETP